MSAEENPTENVRRAERGGIGKAMNKTTLAFALVIQLAIVGVLLAAQSGDVTAPAPFLSFEAQAVDAMTVANEDGAVTLTKVEDGWQLPDGIPADAEKIDEVIDKLANARSGWPVANSASSAERFEVTEANHQRHLTLTAGDEAVADIYLGTSPGYRKTHARLADAEDVYAITFSNYEAGVKAADWLDKSLLQATPPVAAIELLDAFALTKDDEGVWTSADGATLDQGKAETLAGRFTGLSVLGASEAALPEQALAVFQLTDDAGAFKLSLYHFEDEDEYVATSERVAGNYEISSYIAKQMNTTLADLAPDTDDAESDAETVAADDEAAGAPPATVLANEEAASAVDTTGEQAAEGEESEAAAATTEAE